MSAPTETGPAPGIAASAGAAPTVTEIGRAMCGDQWTRGLGIEAGISDPTLRKYRDVAPPPKYAARLEAALRARAAHLLALADALVSKG